MDKKEKLIDKTTIKFLAVGVVNTLVGTGIMFLLYNLAKVPYWPSVIANYVCGGIVSYFLNKYFTFQNKERSWKQVVKFILTVAVCMFIGYGLAKPAVLWALSGVDKTIQENVAMVVGMGLYTGLNYLGQRFFAFKSKD